MTPEPSSAAPPDAFDESDALPSGPVEGPEGASRRVAEELEGALALHLYGGRNTADLGQAALAAVTVLIFWNVVPRWAALGWLGLLVVSALGRALYRKDLAERLEASALRAVVRRDVWISAALWGVFAILLIDAPVHYMALLMVIFAGLVAAATSTLVSDGRAFAGFMVLLMGPLTLSVVLAGLDRAHASLLFVTGLYVPFMVTVYRRAHTLLTEQITAASLLRMSEEETARRRDFLNALVAYAPSAIVVTDVGGRILRANPAFEQTLGHRFEDVHGEPLHALVAWGDDADRLKGFVEAVAGGERVVGELLLRRRNGEPVWMRVSGTAARGLAEGTLIMVGEDVTDQVEAREERERARVEAEEAARAKSSFLASMSHEIRTPMNGILGMIELLLDTDLTDHQRESAEVIRMSGQGLLRILNDVLDMSKIEAGQLDLEAIDFDLHASLGDAARVFALPALNKGIELVVDIGAEVPRGIHGDPVRLRQILTNLLANAIKFTHDGEVVLSARVAARKGNGVDLVFSVRDTGIGVPADKLQAIFNEFEQAETSTTRTHGGTGLGLTICRRLAELMGGRVHVESTPGAGSEFFLELTMRVPASLPENGLHRPAATLRNRDFLVVDDNATARRIVREALATVGAGRVVEAEGVDDGLTQLRQAHEAGRPFAAVVLDHMMPVRDGFELARELVRDPDAQKPPLLMLTSSGDVGSSEAARDAGVDGYLSKPVSRATLLQALSALIEPGGDGNDPGRALVTEATVRDRSRPIRILLAEDNAVNQQVALALLTRQGYEVVAVWNGREAVDTVQSDGGFDVVLMDIQMPEMDGLEATRQIRGLRGYETLPIIALTAHAFSEERERCRRAGMNDFLAKPFKPDDLFALVERWAYEPDAPSALEAAASEDGEGDAGGTVVPAVDLEAFRAVMREAGVEEVVDATVAVYKAEAPKLFGDLREALAEGDLGAARAAAHSLKSSSGNIRANPLAAGLQRMESFARADDLDAARGLLPELEDEYARVMSYLDELAPG